MESTGPNKSKISQQKTQESVMQDEKHPPQVDGFKITGKLAQGKLKDLANLLRTISFLEVVPEKDNINIIYVESRDINKNPYLFSIAKFKEDGIEVTYTIPSGISPRRRKFDVVKYLLNIISLISPSYQVDNKTLYQLIEHTLNDLSSSVSMDYTKLYTSYDSMKKQVGDYKKKIERLTEENQALTSKNYELKAENDELNLRVKDLEGLSDDVLKAKLQEWIVEHNGSINISEFTKLYKMSDTKVEQMLNKLVNDGYLEVVQ